MAHSIQHRFRGWTLAALISAVGIGLIPTVAEIATTLTSISAGEKPANLPLLVAELRSVAWACLGIAVVSIGFGIGVCINVWRKWPYGT